MWWYKGPMGPTRAIFFFTLALPSAGSPKKFGYMSSVQNASLLMTSSGIILPNIGDLNNPRTGNPDFNQPGLNGMRKGFLNTAHMKIRPEIVTINAQGSWYLAKEPGPWKALEDQPFTVKKHLRNMFKPKNKLGMFVALSLSWHIIEGSCRLNSSKWIE